ncbi:methyltransferase domain-containing protein [Chelativorans salis]|uniref:Small RNA 2'-O-methyltransferase n=1 Tax=Chelativorans salis TaxID=2978478 RepID=A0ABT2LVJ0_9HYPH|nr:methyltransferase domain-containing protein [Chelativorans sp. EGI FJ00035]MCT7377593.1 methyltransferase domain-containing protein [Chelativorans sp. EGI FJ00035]
MQIAADEGCRDMTSALHRRRINTVVAELDRADVKSVLDLGCGDGDLVLALTALPRVRRIVGIDVSGEAVAVARRRVAEAGTGKDIEIVQASLTEPAERLKGFDAAVLLEVIEHIDPHRLLGVELAVFETLAPSIVIVTTPNSAYNPFLGVPPQRFRHPDHRFEWDRERFRAWADRVGQRNGYAVRYTDVPPGLPRLGGPSQMAVFKRTH